MKPIFFTSPEDFRAWLEEHHDQEQELWVGYHKKATGKPSLTWPESVDEALCYGWIDGIRKSIDGERYTIRFTPRKPTSNWSAVNLGRIEELTQQGRMKPAGLAAFERRDKKKINQYSFERENVALPEEYDAAFRSHEKAWGFFQSQPPSYRKPAIWWVMSAKQESTRLRRLNLLIENSEQELRIPPLRRG